MKLDNWGCIVRSDLQLDVDVEFTLCRRFHQVAAVSPSVHGRRSGMQNNVIFAPLPHSFPAP